VKTLPFVILLACSLIAPPLLFSQTEGDDEEQYTSVLPDGEPREEQEIEVEAVEGAEPPEPWVSRANISAGLGMAGALDFGGATVGGKYSSRYDNSAGVYAYADFTYAEFGVGSYGAFYAGDIAQSSLAGFNIAFSFALKFPFLAGKTLLYPLVGMETMLCLDQGNTDNDGSGLSAHADAFNRYYLKAGFGADFDLFGETYLRLNVLWGLREASEGERDLYNKIAEGSDVDRSWHQAVQVKIALGRMLR
jgi:hypothetical protein